MNDFLYLKNNWIDGLTVGYSFVTPIATATNKSEQRGSLRYYPLRTLNFSIFESYDEIARIRNNIKYNYGLIYVPILSEPFICDETTDLHDKEDLAISTALYLFNLRVQRVTGATYGGFGYVLIIDKTGTVPPEKIKVLGFTDELDGLHIQIDPIISSILPVNAIFYPLIYCGLDGYSETHLTNEKASLALVFSEQYNKD